MLTISSSEMNFFRSGRLHSLKHVRPHPGFSERGPRFPLLCSFPFVQHVLDLLIFRIGPATHPAGSQFDTEAMLGGLQGHFWLRVPSRWRFISGSVQGCAHALPQVVGDPFIRPFSTPAAIQCPFSIETFQYLQTITPGSEETGKET